MAATPSGAHDAPRGALGFRSVLLVLIAVATVGSAVVWHTAPGAAQTAVMVPAPIVDEVAPRVDTETAVLAGGCFWGVQGILQHVKGVTSAVSGYAGGDADSARYEIVSSGTTGHAESVRITFDPRQISYGRVLQLFFSVVHDPTQRNRQGPDTGPQYRSAIFPTNPEQARIAQSYIAQLDQGKVFGKAIATQIEMSKTFYPAEAYHQDFLTRHPHHPYIVVNDLPKIEDLKRLFPGRYRAAPVLVTTTAGS